MKINGNLTFATLGSGELRNAIIERLASPPTAFLGRLYFNTSDNLYYYYNGTSWSAFEAGTPTPSYGTVAGDTGTASAASSGATLSVVGGEGVATAAITSPTRLTVNLSLNTKLTAATVATGDFLAFADISASNATRKTSVLNFLNDLDIPNGISANGIVARTAADTYTARTITGITNRITVTNGDGAAGAPNIDIAAAYAGQSSITTVGTITTGVWNGTNVAIAKGGTGQSTATSAFNALAPTQSGNSGRYLTTDGTNTSWDILTLNDLADVSITTPSDGDVLTYHAGSPTRWIAAPASGGGAWNYDLSGATFATPSDGDVMLKFIAVRDFKLPTDLVDSQFYVGTPPASSGVITVSIVNAGSPIDIGTITFDDTGAAVVDVIETSVLEGDQVRLTVTTSDSMDDIVITLKTASPSL